MLLRRIAGPRKSLPALEFDLALAEGVSPLLQVSRDDPATLLIHGDKDTLVKLNQNRQIDDAFRNPGVTCGMLVSEGAGHGFNGNDRVRATRALVEWFDRHLTKK